MKITTQAQLLLDQKRYPLEADLTSKVKDWLDLQRDISYWKASDRYTKGVSDIILCVGGWFVGAELKADDGVPSPQQSLFIREMLKVNGIAGVCYTLGEVKALVEEARQRTVLYNEVRQRAGSFPANTGED
ncbi:hypothetical protein D3C79_887780 [compost metagenome]